MKRDKDQIDKDLGRDEVVDWTVLVIGISLFASAVVLALVGAS
jgi:hypothetical protein